MPARSSQRPDSKTQKLIDWLGENLKPKGTWNTERVIIFTEYRATQKWLYDLLARHGFAEEGRLELIYGGMPSDQREPIKAAFQASPADAAVRILLATDAASEGVNLQNYCSKLIHFEIPWNPNRMEQRNGRVDRHGQKADEVQIFHFVGQGFGSAEMAGKVGDLEADLEFLMRAALKVETIREDLGKVGPVIAWQVEEAMLGKRTQLDTARAEQEAEPVRRILKFERKLREQMEKLAAQLDETKRELNLTPEHVENMVRVALELAGQPPLVPIEVKGIWPDPLGMRKTCPVFRLPAMSGSWSQCAEGLAHPHTHVIRPIVFDADLAAGRDDVVLVHLNHRLVQMCLRLLRAEIWNLGNAGKRLSRVTACVVEDSALSNPVVIAHGRIVVLGGDNHRIHEEIITAGGAIIEGRFTRLNVGETKAALQSASSVSVPESIQERFRSLWPKHQEPLMSALEARRVERTKNLEQNFEEIAGKEVDKLRTVMTELQRAIGEELDSKDGAQMLLDLGGDERAQRDRDLAALRRRFDEIPGEIEKESAHLRDRYRNPSARLFPGRRHLSDSSQARSGSWRRTLMSVSRHHADWLSLVESSGPFLSLPVLLRAFPQGLDPRDPEQAKQLRLAYEEWQENPNLAAKQRAWVMHVLTQVLLYPKELLAEGQTLPPGLTATMAEYGEILRPELALLGPMGSELAGKPQLLISLYPVEQSLEKPVTGKHWKATPGTRMMELLHATDVALGLVTNGEEWMLVFAPRGDTTGFTSWYASLWIDEPITLRAFHSLLSTRRFFGVAPSDTLLALLKESAQDQQEVTNQLGDQVRDAVEVLIQAFDRLDQDSGRTLLKGLDEKSLYDAALTVMMRLVFLFSAEERGLLHLGEPLYDDNYAVSTLREQLQEVADHYGEEVLERRHDGWARLLATFRAVHGGVNHQDLMLPAYGGSLFDPDRYPFLEGRAQSTRWQSSPAAPLEINNRVVLHLLKSLQMLQVKVPGGGPAEALRVSFEGSASH